MLGAHTQSLGQFGGEALCLFRTKALRCFVIGDPARVMPQRQTVGAPVAGQRPARQRFARIPLALGVVQEAIGRETVTQLFQQPASQLALGRTTGSHGPLGAIHIVDGDKGRFTAHGQAHIARTQLLIDGVAERFNRLPLFFGIGLGDPRILVDARDVHLEAELGLALVGIAGDRCSARRGWRTGQRNMALASEQTRGRVQTDPAGAGHKYFRPGMQVSEIHIGTGRTIQRLDIGGELDQVARDKARRQAQMAQDLHQQPGRIAAGAGALAQGLLAALHPGFHADDVADVLAQTLVQADQEVDDPRRLAADHAQPFLQQRAVFLHVQIRRQLTAQSRLVGEGVGLGVALDEEVEGVDHRHLGDQIDGDTQFTDLLGEHQPGLEIAKRILHPVDEILARRLDAQRIGMDGGAGVRRGSQANHMRRDADRTVEAVGGLVMQGNAYGHGQSFVSIVQS